MFNIKNRKQYLEETSRKISWGHWFTFFNILWAIIIGSRYAFIIDWPNTLVGKLYFFVSLLGHFSFVVFASYLLLIFPLSFLVKNQRTFRGLTVIISTLGVTLLLVDTEVFSRFNLHLSSLVWNLLVNPENGELSRNWQLFFVPMPLILLAQMVFSRWSWEKLRSLERQKWLKAVGVFFVCTFTATHLIYAWADAYIYRPITMQKSNFPLSYPMTARSFLEKHGFLDKAKYSQTLEQEGRLDALEIHYPKAALRFAEQLQSQAKTNLVIITVSGLRQDSIKAENTPALQHFAENSTQYTNHYSTGNNDNTGATGIFYGISADYMDSLLSNKTPSVFFQYLQQQKAQYALGVFSSTNFSSPLVRQALGMNKVKKRKTDNQTEIQGFQRWYDKALQQDKSVVAYLSLNIADGLDESAYNQALQTLDQQLAPMLAQLETSDAIVILTAEHGYHFAPLEEKEATNYFAPEQLQVPLIIHWNQLPVGEVTQLTSHTDILPTLMKHLFALQNPMTDYAQGVDLLNLPNKRQWVLAGNYRWNVIITPNGEQYHIDDRGNYQKYDRTYQKTSSDRPPLGLFLEVFNQESSFMEK